MRTLKAMIGLANTKKLRADGLLNLLPVALVSRHFYRIVTPLTYQTIYIDISGCSYPHPHVEDHTATKRPLSTLISRLSAGPAVLALVRNIHVFGRDGVHPGALELLIGWLPKLRQLCSFSWNCDGSFPPSLLTSLGQHWPKAHLDMRTSFSKCDIKKDWKVLRLAPNMLRSLHVCMPNYPYDRVGKEARVAKSKLLWALRSCPGLHSLTTYDPNVYRNNRGLGASEPWHDLKPDFLLPQLAELTIADKTFEVDDLLKWGAKGGWTKLTKITLWDDRLLYGFQGCEQSLRSISLLHTKAENENALVSICSRTIRLTELKIKTEESRLPFSALMICGPSLETLAIHPHRDALDNWINMQDVPLCLLQAIQRLCPGLTNLALNLRWPPDNPASLQT